MTIDPTAAVTSATSGVGSPAASADPAASATSASGLEDAADQSAKADLFDYTSQHQNKPPAIDTLRPEGKANYLSNPAALGEKVLERMEGLHQRSLEFKQNLREGGGISAAGGGEGPMSGPASTHVAGTAKQSPTQALSGLQLMFDYAIETTMISNSSSQFVSSVNTLMRGQ